MPVGEDVDPCDLPTCDGEGHDRHGLSLGCGHDSGGAVHQGEPGERSEAREGEGLLADGAGSAHGRGSVSAAVCPQDDVRVEQGEEVVEPAGPRGGHERLDHLALPGRVGIRNGPRPLDAAARAARELTGRGGGASGDRGDLVEGQGEHVVQHECEPLGGCQRVENDQQRESDRVAEHRLLLGIGHVQLTHARIRHMDVEWLLAASLP
ncbi:hypothetical protein W59_02174 [Rhodococcus opacus RKJ300 = JCM 13270]|uniref:Uncharacterized protein n=1 Tax=Rhodococcus opacus RKJ300 = JCM 13270 TaxID=1165867 RepID=I0WZ30_RHOOP|nr:hypothetical protein W59_02174 [Rhodococcus opacus RKJ300 = JCM 13270]